MPYKANGVQTPARGKLSSAAENIRTACSKSVPGSVRRATPHSAIMNPTRTDTASAGTARQLREFHPTAHDPLHVVRAGLLGHRCCTHSQRQRICPLTSNLLLIFILPIPYFGPVRGPAIRSTRATALQSHRDHPSNACELGLPTAARLASGSQCLQATFRPVQGASS